LQKTTVTAVIVTFNRLEKVKHTIDHVLAQTHPIEQVVIIDNASTDGTDEYLAELAANNPKIQNIRSKENTGGAGGFNKGIREAYQTGADMIWVMDDDCYAYPDALEKLVAGYEGAAEKSGFVPGFACSLVKWHDDLCEMNIPEPVWDWPRHYDPEKRQYMLIKHCSFVSVLIPRGKVKQVGLPISEFFIWFDDVEYTKRLARGYPGIYVLDSLVHHDLEKNEGVNFGLVNKGNLWKYRYGARNQAYYHKTLGFWDWFSYAVNRNMQMKRYKLPLSLRWELNKAMINGLFMKVKKETVE